MGTDVPEGWTNRLRSASRRQKQTPNQNLTSTQGGTNVDDLFKNPSVQLSKKRRNDDNNQGKPNGPSVGANPRDDGHHVPKKSKTTKSSETQLSEVGEAPGVARSAQKTPKHPPEQVARGEASQRPRLRINPKRPHTSLESQMDIKPISLEQLKAEVDGICTGLTMIEKKCIEVHTEQSANTTHKLSGGQWQAVIALHRTLLHEHYDFFLASQHPAASHALRRLAIEKNMPARLWRHGIRSLLELLRHRLPDSYDYMLAFFYIAYDMLRLMHETVRAFEDIWAELLGDLAKYGMLLVKHDIKDRETWTAVARSWYTKVSEKAPTTGRVYHELAILARPNVVHQIYYYTKSLVVAKPFLSARESITTLYGPAFTPNPPRLESIDLAFVRVHVVLFSGKHQEYLTPAMENYYTRISLACALLGYGAKDHFMMQLIDPAATDKSGDQVEGVELTDGPDETFNNALTFMVKTYAIAVKRLGDPHTLPFLHTILAFMLHLSRFPKAMSHVAPSFPWELTAKRLNTLLKELKKPKHGEPKRPEPEPIFEEEDFPGTKAVKDEETEVKKAAKKKLAGTFKVPDYEEEKKRKAGLPRALPEDWAMYGLIYTGDYFPKKWFRYSLSVEEDEKYLESSSMDNPRMERILWLGYRLAYKRIGLTWDKESRQFGVAEEFEDPVEDTATSKFRARI